MQAAAYQRAHAVWCTGCPPADDVCTQRVEDLHSCPNRLLCLQAANAEAGVANVSDTLMGLAGALTTSTNLSDFLLDDLAAFMAGSSGALGRRLLQLGLQTPLPGDGIPTEKARAAGAATGNTSCDADAWAAC